MQHQKVGVIIAVIRHPGTVVRDGALDGRNCSIYDQMFIYVYIYSHIDDQMFIYVYIYDLMFIYSLMQR